MYHFADRFVKISNQKKSVYKLLAKQKLIEKLRIEKKIRTLFSTVIC